jgi:hypothetical protein
MAIFDDDPDWVDIDKIEKLKHTPIGEAPLGAEGDLIKMAEQKDKFESLKKLAGVDNVNHPQHYCREDAMECINEMILIFGKEAVKNFCLCNAWKYRYRAADKNGEEDLRKSDWYIRKYKELSGEDCCVVSEKVINTPPYNIVLTPTSATPKDWLHPAYGNYSTTGSIN